MSHKYSILFLALGCLVFFYSVFFFNQVIFFGDNLALKVPQTLYLVERLKQGSLPFWNPYTMAGMPFIADISSTTFYPLNFFYFFLSPLSALTYQTISSIFLLGVFTYLYVKTLKLSNLAATTTAISYMFSSSIIHKTSDMLVLSSVMWLPLTLLSFHQYLKHPSKRTWLSITSISLSLQILGGHPQPVFFTIILLGCYSLFLFKNLSLLNKLVKLCLVGLTTFGLCAFLLLPAIQMTRLTTRSHLSYASATIDSPHPLLFIRLIFPNLLDNPKIGMAWGPAWRHVSDNKGYLGVSSVFIIIIILFNHLRSPKQKDKSQIALFFTAAFIVSIITALGKYTPIYRILFTLLPGFNHLRGPSKIFLITNFSFSILLGLAINKLQQIKLPQRQINKAFIFAMVGMVFSLITYIFYQPILKTIWHQPSVFHTFDRDLVIFQQLTQDIFIIFTLITTIILILRTNKTWFLTLIIFTDLFYFNSTQLFTVPRQTINTNSDITSELKHKITPQDRFITFQDFEPFTGLGNYWENMTHQPPFAESFYDTNEQHKFTILNQRLSNFALNWHLPNNLPTPNGYSSFVLTNYSKYLDHQASTQPLNSPNTSTLTPSVLDQLSVKYYLSSEGVNVRDSALPRARLINQSSQQVQPADITINNPEHIQINTESSLSSTLVLADSYYPGWKAYIDDQPTEIQPYQELFLSTILPAGKHTVDFKYSERMFNFGILMSIVTVLGLITYTKQELFIYIHNNFTNN